MCLGDADIYSLLFGQSQEKRLGPCGHVFKKGEIIYRCIDCGLDSTCVMCMRCFKASQHHTHNTNLHYSQGTCSIHCNVPGDKLESGSDAQPLPEPVLASIRNVITLVLEFIIDTLKDVPKPVIASSIESVAAVPSYYQQDSGLALEYSVVLWNDESHSFSEVIDQLQESIEECSDEEARLYAERVDAYGRDIVYSGPPSNYSRLVGIGRKIAAIGLVTSIQASAHILREDLAIALLEWLGKLPSLMAGQKMHNNVLMQSVEAQTRKLLVEELQAAPVSFQDQRPSLSVWEPRIESRADFLLIWGGKLWKSPKKILKEFMIGTLIIQSEESKRYLGMRYATHYLEIARQYLLDTEGQKSYELSILSLSVQTFTVPTTARVLVKETNILAAIMLLLKAIYMQENYPDQVKLTDDFYGGIQIASVTPGPKFALFECKQTVGAFKNAMFYSDYSYLIDAASFSLEPFLNPQSLASTLDLLLFLQGMHLQKRAITTHVEYESENWFSPLTVSLSVLKALHSLSQGYYMLSKRDPSQILQLIDCVHALLLEWSLSDHWESISRARLESGSTIVPVADGFHTLTLYGALPQRIPDRRVGFHSLSIYHPLHWLLSYLLAELPRLFHGWTKDQIQPVAQRIFSGPLQIPSSTDSKEQGPLLSMESMAERFTAFERQLLVFDYPFQTVSFVAQVRAGIWVRNGSMVRNQVVHFRDIALREAYDRNIFLLQYASIKFGGDVFLSELVDRFDIPEWFLGAKENSNGPSFTREQELVLAQDLFHLIIIVLSERSELAAFTSTQRIRYEIIHQLASSSTGLPYSELDSRVNDSSKDDESATFDQILYSVSNFKYPETLTDRGMYSLKDEFYDEVQPWFWHFSRNQREDLEENLKVRNRTKKEQLQTVSETHLLNLPRLAAIQPGSGFDRVGALVHSQTFMHLLLMGLWNVSRPLLEKPGTSILNETIFSQVIQLVLLGLYISEKELSGSFLSNMRTVTASVALSTGGDTRNTSLLDILLSLIDRANETDLKDMSPRLRYIARTVEERGGEEERSIINGWRDKSRWNFFSATAPVALANATASAAERKAAAKARKAAIMAQFNDARNSFMANFGDEVDNNEEEDGMDVDLVDKEVAVEGDAQDTRECPFVEGICIVCQEDTKNSTQLFGMLCYLQVSNIQRQLDVSDTSNLKKIIEGPASFDLEIERPQFVPVTAATINQIPLDSEPLKKNRFSKNGCGLAKRSVVPTTCGHLMHITCMQAYMASVRSRHATQPMRNHPENLLTQEILCPLCKGIGNSLLPVVWKTKREQKNFNGSQQDPSRDTDLAQDLEAYLNNDIQYLLSGSSPARLVQDTQHSSDHSSQVPGAFPAVETGIRQRIFDCMAPLAPELFSSSNQDRNITAICSALDSLFIPNLDAMHRSQDLTIELSPLLDLFVSLVNSLEISSRGTPGATAIEQTPDPACFVGILDQLNASQLSLVRSLSETCVLSLLAKNPNALERYTSNLMKSIFCGSADIIGLLRKSGFTLLTYIVMTVLPFKGFSNPQHGFYWVRMFGVFEMVRICVSIIESLLLHGTYWLDSKNLQTAAVPREELRSLSSLFHYVAKEMGANSVLSLIANLDHLVVMYRILQSSMNIYARKAVLLLYARFGYVPLSGAASFAQSAELSPQTDTAKVRKLDFPSELERLSGYLSLIPMAKGVGLTRSPVFSGLIRDWCKNLKVNDEIYWSSLANADASDRTTKKQLVSLDQSGVFELITLPNRLEDLFEAALARPCAKCQSVPQDPAICLLCGLIVCSQSQCCAVPNEGECNLHMRTCGASVAMYMSIRKCIILLLSEGKGTFAAPPYLDIHGELDHSLRRGKPQFLNWKRYGELRKIWLSHGIPSQIARKMDQMFDTGGWSTF
ncbi:hypothetical protein HDV03_002727 [Kappamyces sp. JEL0829]|nr:hypothetical protein HDV03_002727 [Kappamyces sp. JEL0829]